MEDWYINLLKILEGFKPTAYWDNGHYSIGYGSGKMLDGSPVKKDSKITESDATVALKKHIDESKIAAKKVFPKFDSYPELAQAAIIDIMYRGGTNAFSKSPKFKEALTKALEDNFVSSEELTTLLTEMGYNSATGGIKDRKGRRAAMLAGIYDPNNNKTAYSKKSIYTNMSTDPNTMWGQVLRTRNLDQNFIKRLWDPNRESIKDWNSNKIVTHRLSYQDTDDGYDMVYPEVLQNVEKGLFGTEYTTGLIDYTDPKNKGTEASDIAVQMGDTIRVPVGMGKKFTTTYKQYYPYFDYAR